MKPLNPIIEILTTSINKIKSFFSQVLHVTAWIPYLWKNRDYDYTYIYYILGKKLKDVQKELADSNWEVSNLFELQEAIDICNRLYIDGYLEEAIEKIEEVYPYFFDGEFRDDENGFMVYESRYKHDEFDKEIYNKYMKEYEDGQKQDLKRLGEILSEYSLKWWD